jgi:hypothetical protein
VYPGQIMHISTNLTVSKVNDHVNLQWSSYKQLQGLNLRPQKKQTFLSKLLPLKLGVSIQLAEATSGISSIGWRWDELGFGRVTVQGMQMQLEPAVKG